MRHVLIALALGGHSRDAACSYDSAYSCGTEFFWNPATLALTAGVVAAYLWVAYLMSARAALAITKARPAEGPQFQMLRNVVEGLSIAAGIPMPAIYVVDDPAPNAFATGAFRDSALVAVSTGLLQGMTREEVEAVLGHEIAHIANGDMVTLTLILGVLNTFVVFLSRVVGYVVDSAMRKNDEENTGPGMGYYITSIVLDIVLGFVASMIVAWFSRQREFRADQGAAQLMGQKQAMINALARLGHMQAGELPKSVAAMGITSELGKLFATHPPLEERIAALQSS